MNIYHTINNLQVNNITICNPIANKFSNYDKFYKILYNTNGMTMNSIYLLVDIDNMHVIEEHKKYKLVFNIDDNTIEKIKRLEISLLEKVNQFLQKDIILNCNYNLLNNKYIYSPNIISKKNKKIYIRISGIWESNNQIGLTTKMTLLDL
jgi:hypothetical protein